MLFDNLMYIQSNTGNILDSMLHADGFDISIEFPNESLKPSLPIPDKLTPPNRTLRSLSSSPK